MDEPNEPPVNPTDLLKFAGEAEVFVDSIVEELLIRGADALYDHYLDEKNDPFIVKQTTAILTNALEVQNIRRDAGELQTWDEEVEPMPCAIDTWGRAAVPIKKKSSRCLALLIRGGGLQFLSRRSRADALRY